jgi:hypothetical protein
MTKEWTVVIAMADGNAIGTLDAFAVHGRGRGRLHLVSKAALFTHAHHAREAANFNQKSEFIA